MKKFLMGFIILIFFISCKKNNPEPQATVTSSSVTTSRFITNDTVAMYPNPTSGAIFMGIAVAENANCTIRIIAGKNSPTIYNQNLTAKTWNTLWIKFNNYPTEALLIQVTVNSKVWEFTEFI